ncbi:MAG: methyltransferase [Planctomycetales bacterium]|nr:methyltransferase [Planctomycetales bacterium]
MPNGTNLQFVNREGLYAVNRFQSLLLADCACFEAVELCATTGRRLQDLRAHEICCGGGPAALALKASGVGHVEASDVNPQAVECCRSNAEHNGLSLERLAVFDVARDSHDETFDLLLCNAPCGRADQMPRRATPDIARAVDGGEAGIDVTSTVMQRAASWLRPAGRLVFVVTSMMDYRAVEQTLNKLFFRTWRVSIGSPLAQPFLPIGSERAGRLLQQCERGELFVWDGGDGWLWRLTWIVVAAKDAPTTIGELSLANCWYDIRCEGYRNAMTALGLSPAREGEMWRE